MDYKAANKFGAAALQVAGKEEDSSQCVRLDSCSTRRKADVETLFVADERSGPIGREDEVLQRRVPPPPLASTYTG